MPDPTPVLEAPLDPNAPPPAAPPPPDAWAKDWVKDGAFDHSALDKAPDDFKSARAQFETFKNPFEMAKSLSELRKLASAKGADLLQPLAKDATPEMKNARLEAIRKAVGAPDKPEGYVIEKPKDWPDAQWDAAAVKEAAAIAHKNGVSNDALKDFVSYDLARQQKAQAASAEATKALWAGQESLAREAAAKEGMTYDQAIGFAERAGKKFAGVDKDNPIFKNATFLMMAARVGKAMGEDKLIQGDTSDDALKALTPDTALAALKDITDNKNNPKWAAYWNRDPENKAKEKVHVDHEKVVAEAKRLSALAYSTRKR